MFTYKKLNIFLGLLLVLTLSACNNNNDDAFETQNTYDEALLVPGRGDGIRKQYSDYGRQFQYGVNNFDRTRRNTNQSNMNRPTTNGEQQNRGASINSAGQNDFPAEAVQEINHGFITIDPNSYSTSTPSKKYPHSKYISKRQFIFYGGVFPGQGKEQAGQPGQGQAKQPEQAQPEQQQPNAAPTQPGQQQPNATPTQPQQQQPEAAPTQPGQQPKETAPTQKEEQQAAPTGQGITSIESRVIQLTNDERRKNGLPDLKPDTALSNVAREKSNDMQKNNYFSHTSPTYGSPFDMMRDFGISFKSAGENIAQGQRSPEEVVQAWMNSEGHRKNILSPTYTHIGVGHVANGNYWTQMFISK